MALVTVKRLLILQAAFHHCWNKKLNPLEAKLYLDSFNITLPEIEFYQEWAAGQPHNDMPEEH